MPPESGRTSVWDRLVGSAADADLPGVLPRDRQEALRESIRSELSRLLNSRRSCLVLTESFAELRRSAVSYGIPDFTAANAKSPQDREALRSEIERTIRVFEPRLTSVRVDLIDPGGGADRAVCLRIDARLRIGGRNENVAYESRMDALKGRFDVKVSDS